MNLDKPEMILLIVTIAMIGWLINNWIRARHGYALNDDLGRKIERRDDAATQALRTENAELKEKVEHFADRVQVLERIVTDKGYDVATKIEALRDARQPEERR